MPLVSRKEFAELCGDPVPKINVWIGRDKLVLHPADKKLMDTEDPLNKAFIEARQVFNAAKGNPKEEKQPKEPKKKLKFVDIEGVRAPGRPKKGNEKRVNPAEIQKKERQLAEQHNISKLRLDQDMQKKALEIENLELEREKRKLELQKKAGELMPVDLVMGVLKRHADSINKSFEKGIESLVTSMTHTLAHGNQVVYGKYLGMAKQTLSDCIIKAGKSADEEVSILVDEFSQTLGRGQRR